LFPADNILYCYPIVCSMLCSISCCLYYIVLHILLFVLHVLLFVLYCIIYYCLYLYIVLCFVLYFVLYHCIVKCPLHSVQLLFSFRSLDKKLVKASAALTTVLSLHDCKCKWLTRDQLIYQRVDAYRRTPSSAVTATREGAECGLLQTQLGQPGTQHNGRQRLQDS